MRIAKSVIYVIINAKLSDHTVLEMASVWVTEMLVPLFQSGPVSSMVIY